MTIFQKKYTLILLSNIQQMYWEKLWNGPPTLNHFIFHDNRVAYCINAICLQEVPNCKIL